MGEQTSTSPDRVIEEIDADECLRLIAAGGVGRIAYTSRSGPAIRPVNYRLIDGAIVFRTAEHGELAEDLTTGIADAEYRVAFEIDAIDPVGEQGWSVLLQGPAHHLTEAERAGYTEGAESSGSTGPAGNTGSAGNTVRPWAGGQRDLFMRIVPARITGRRVGPA
jgi:nitroimidazol reductase NimA-like FMN-containing flavoprotein (pyridoxamine 5'-phosphate oxidase superfamily)